MKTTIDALINKLNTLKQEYGGNTAITFYVDGTDCHAINPNFMRARNMDGFVGGLLKRDKSIKNQVQIPLDPTKHSKHF